MPSPEFSTPKQEQNPRLDEILSRFGDVMVTAHGKTMTVGQARTECPPFIDALLRTKSPEQLEQIINIYKA